MMTNKAFTMLELIFVIVILGILASIIIPKLAATREDADVTNLKVVLKQAQSTMPSYYTAQRSASFNGAMSFRTSTDPASKNVFVFTDAKECTAVYRDKTGDSVVMRVVNNAADAPTVPCTEGEPAADANLSLLITYNFLSDDVVSQVAALNQKSNGESDRFPLGGAQVDRD